MNAHSIKTLGIVSVVIAVACISCTSNDRQKKSERIIEPRVGDYTISGPYTHENLTFFLFHGKDKLQGEEFLTLQEAMEKNMVIVHETGDVSELSIENVSDSTIYIQSGDIVKGGRQDRVLAFDFIVPPRSGKMPIASYCVESGRWSARGQERVDAFGESSQQLATKDLKLAAKGALRVIVAAGGASSGQPQQAQQQVLALADAQQNAPQQQQQQAQEQIQQAQQQQAEQNQPQQQQQPQQDQQQTQQQDHQRQVWKGVAEAQQKLQEKSAEYVQAKGGEIVDRLRRMEDVRMVTLDSQDQARLQVVSPASPSSMQLALESKPVQEITEDYVKKLASIPADKGDVVGFAFAINGKLNSMDIYASNALFKKLWSKALRAAAVEALAEFKKDNKFEIPTTIAVKSAIEEAEKSKAGEKEINARVNMTVRDNDKSVLFDTFDRERKGQLVHRNLIVK